VDTLVEPGSLVYNDFVGLLPDAIFPGPSFDYADAISDGEAVPFHLCYRYGDPVSSHIYNTAACTSFLFYCRMLVSV